MPSNIWSGTAVAVTVTTAPLILKAANPGRRYLSISLPVAGTLWVGTAGVTTTGTASGFAVTATQPFIMSDPDSIYVNSIYGITTAICTPSIVELSA